MTDALSVPVSPPADLPDMTLPSGACGGRLLVYVERRAAVARADVRLMAEAMARLWSGHRREVRRLIVRLVESAELPDVVRQHPTMRAAFSPRENTIHLAIDRLRGGAVPFQLELMLAAVHETCHVIQVARGEAPVGSYTAAGDVRADYLEDPLEREARWYAAEVLKGMFPDLEGHFTPRIADWVDLIPAASRFTEPAPAPQVHYVHRLRSWWARLRAQA